MPGSVGFTKDKSHHNDYDHKDRDGRQQFDERKTPDLTETLFINDIKRMQGVPLS